eukprot:TRINITY_DN36765_c0_g1_i2.p1 TRINITY_DN36765_c0_g1~~TRINITY_DN36765_c0_g1_i2.p1  ORF type:complete len:104 (-),score=8.44 TRINITY_DN36765_c0_g1_i2:273-584(-)
MFILLLDFNLIFLKNLNFVFKLLDFIQFFFITKDQSIETLIFDSEFLISSSSDSFDIFFSISRSVCICILSARMTLSSSSCILFMFSILDISSVIYLSLELAK